MAVPIVAGLPPPTFFSQATGVNAYESFGELGVAASPDDYTFHQNTGKLKISARRILRFARMRKALRRSSRP